MRKLTIIFLMVFMVLVFLPATYAAQIKVACIGDSITYGIGVGDANAQSYPAVLQRMLGAGYLVNNYGVSGTTMLKQGDYSYWGTQQYTDSKLWLPNIVIIMLGTNDSKSQNWQYQSSFVANYEEMINSYKNLSSHPTVYVNTCPAVYNTGLAGITNAIVHDQVIPKVRQAASDTGCTVIDVNTATSGMTQNFPDNVHPNADGAKCIAAAVYNGLTAPGVIGSFQTNTYTNAKYTHAMPYRLFVPANYNVAQSYPLVLFLHGAGERGSDNNAQLTANQGATVWAEPYYQANHPCFVLAPQCPANEQWVDTPWGNGSYNQNNVPVSDELQMVQDIIAKVRTQYNIDSGRIYSTGISMGGYGTWDINLRNPQLFAAAVPVCGAGDPAKANLIAAKPIWACHGDADPTVPVSGSRDMVNGLRSAGGNPKYTEYPGVGHDCWVQTFCNINLIDWVFSNGKQNLVLKKTATASQSISGEGPEKAIDGSTASYNNGNSKWCSNASGDKWLKVDLGQSYDISRWVVKHAGAGGESAQWDTKDFKLQKSADGNSWTDVDTVTGNILDITDRTVTVFNARYVRLYITNAGADGVARIYEFEVLGVIPVVTNIALNKNATANQYLNGESPEKAVDGSVAVYNNGNSKWCANVTGDKWLRADLGQNYDISRWVVYHAGAGGENITLNTKDFRLQKSVDGNNWTDVDVVTGNTANITDRNVTKFTARYIRLYITNAGADSVVRVYELQLYGSPTPTAPPLTVNLASYFNQDGFSYDSNRADGAFDPGAPNTSCYAADQLNGSPTFDYVSYTLGPKTDGAKNEIYGAGQTVALTQGQYSSIRFLSSATNGDQTGVFRINYMDGSYSDTNVTVKDWCSSDTSSQNMVAAIAHRHQGNSDQSVYTYIFAYSLAPVIGKTVSSIVLPNNANIHVLAITQAP